jgi:uncharacterized membrane protein
MIFDILRAVIGIPLLLFIPGNALLMALMPRRGRGKIVETLTLSVVLSLTVVPFLGLLLNYTPWGITIETVLYSVSIFILICLIVAWYRSRHYHSQTPVFEEKTVIPEKTKPSLLGSGVRDWTLTVIMVFASMVAIVLLAGFIMAPKGQEKFTSFYMVGQDSSPESSVVQLKVGQQGKMTVGILNWEGKDTNYRVVILVDGQNSGEIGPIPVQSEQEWRGEVTFSPTKAARQKVELILYENQDIAPALKPLYFWIDGED